MPYSPFVGPALLLLLVLPAIVGALKKPRAEGTGVKRSTLWGMAAGTVVLSGVQLALNAWKPWIGDALLAAGFAVLLFLTRRK